MGKTTQTDTFKRLRAVMKDVNGDNRQIVRTLQDQVEYLLEKVAILEEIATEANGGKVPVYSEGQKKRLAYRGRKLNEFLLATVERTFAPGTLRNWYNELVGVKYDSTKSPNQKKRGRKPISQEIVDEVLLLAEHNPRGFF